MSTPGERQAPLDDRLGVIEHVAHRFGLTDLSNRVAAVGTQTSDSRLAVVVLGAFKAGKSSLLNSIIGDDVLPVRAIPSTCVPTVLQFGEHLSATVRSTLGAVSSVSPWALADFVTEGANPDNIKGIERVEVNAPGLAAFPNLVFVDTPGLSSVHETSAALSTRWLPRVAVAVVVVSAVQPLSAADRDLLQQVAVHTPHVLVVVSKIDLVAEPERADLCAYVRREAQAGAGYTGPVLAYSTAPPYGHLRARLRAQLARLQAHEREVAAALLAHRTERLVQDTRTYLALAIAAAEADAESATRLRTALAAERARLPATRTQAHRLVRPAAQQLQAVLVDQLQTELATLSAEVLCRLPDQARLWRGSLAHEVVLFSDWFVKTLTDALAGPAQRAADRAARQITAAGDPLEVLREAFVQRLAAHVRETLGVAFDVPLSVPPEPRAQRADVIVGPVFDNRLDLLSWAVPMRLVRPLVHRHFASLTRRQVETNVLRLAYQVASRAAAELDSFADSCVDVMDGELAACERLVGALQDEGPLLRQHLSVLSAGDGAAAQATAGRAG